MLKGTLRDADSAQTMFRQSIGYKRKLLDFFAGINAKCPKGTLELLQVVRQDAVFERGRGRVAPQGTVVNRNNLLNRRRNNRSCIAAQWSADCRKAHQSCQEKSEKKLLHSRHFT